MWFDRFWKWDWSACCRQHDIDYTVGLTKSVADHNLENCVNAVLPGMGYVMWAGLALLPVSLLFYGYAVWVRNRK